MDPIGFAIGALAHNILNGRLLPPPKRKPLPQSYSYRRVRPFPLLAPVMDPSFDFSKDAWNADRAWHDEYARREGVRFLWNLRKARRAARPPKGHDHPDWV